MTLLSKGLDVEQRVQAFLRVITLVGAMEPLNGDNCNSLHNLPLFIATGCSTMILNFCKILNMK